MITEEIKEKVKELYSKGRTKKDISFILDISICSITNILGHNKKISDELREEAKELYKQGLIKAEIALKLGISWYSVSRIVSNKVYIYKPTPNKSIAEKRREKIEREKRLKDLIKDEEVIYPSELDKCLAEIRYRDNHIEPPKTIIK
jgi:orotate phosphoribosyltransferase-like protein